MPCEEWCRLVEHYRSAVSAYNDAVKALDVLPGLAFNEAWPRAERERAKCDRRRADLLHHEHAHACLEVGRSKGRKPVSNVSTDSLVLGDQGQSGG